MQDSPGRRIYLVKHTEMKTKIRNIWCSLLGGILALLGFQVCKGILDIGRCEYGQPHANYKLMGDVKDQAGKPIKGIRVIFAPRGLDDEYPEYHNDTLYTNAAGHFELAQTKYNWPGQESSFTIVADDVDGEENGSYESQTISGDKITVKQSQRGDGKWYGGDFDIEAQLVLKKKSE